MTRTTARKLALFPLLISTFCVRIFAQGIVQPSEASAASMPYDKLDAADAPYIIFSNLDSDPTNRYNSDSSDALTIAGNRVTFETEQWIAVGFTPKVDVQANVLMAAVGYTSGTKLVNLGIYSDDDGKVGTLLPGAQGSTTKIPDLGECCQMAKVVLPEAVALDAGTHYWLVAGPDNTTAADFLGAWHLSNQARYGSFYPSDGAIWATEPGLWPAAQIRGTKIQAAGARRVAKDALTANAIIFSTLDRESSEPYLPTHGLFITGSAVFNQAEQWHALPFTPQTDVHAISLATAVAYTSGTRLVNLGIYSDDNGNVGTPLPGGQVSTTDIPDDGDCCELTRVTLPGSGVALSAGVQYWLVVTPDDVNAPDFFGIWQASNLALEAYQEPEHFIPWTTIAADLLAAEIRGTIP